MKRPDTTIDSLFDQTKCLVIKGSRLSGEPEILHEIEEYYRHHYFFPIVRGQIRAILEHVPKTFPEGWKSPHSYDGLNEQERRAYEQIARKGIMQCTGPVIQRVIELAVECREKYGRGHKQ